MTVIKLWVCLWFGKKALGVARFFQWLSGVMIRVSDYFANIVNETYCGACGAVEADNLASASEYDIGMSERSHLRGREGKEEPNHDT